jgi:hypothetical protein
VLLETQRKTIPAKNTSSNRLLEARTQFCLLFPANALSIQPFHAGIFWCSCATHTHISYAQICAWKIRAVAKSRSAAVRVRHNWPAKSPWSVRLIPHASHNELDKLVSNFDFYWYSRGSGSHIEHVLHHVLCCAASISERLV